MDFILLTCVDPLDQKVMNRISDINWISQEDGYCRLYWYKDDEQEELYSDAKESIETIYDLIKAASTFFITNIGGL